MITETRTGFSHLWEFTFILCYNNFYPNDVSPLSYNRRMAYPFCNSTKELEDTEALDALFFYVFWNKKKSKENVRFLFEIHTPLFQRIIIPKRENSCMHYKHSERGTLCTQNLHFICQYHHSHYSVGSCVLSIALFLPFWKKEQNISDFSYTFPVLHLKSSISPNKSCCFQ